VPRVNFRMLGFLIGTAVMFILDVSNQDPVMNPSDH